MREFIIEADATTTRGSSIRPLPEGAVFVRLVRAEDDHGLNTSTFVALMTREQALKYGADILRAASDLPLVNGEVCTPALDRLVREHNVAVANGNITEARRIARVIDAGGRDS